jgi:hypothetical protein
MNEIEGVVRYKSEHNVDRLIRKFSNLIPQVVPSVDELATVEIVPRCALYCPSQSIWKSMVKSIEIPTEPTRRTPRERRKECSHTNTKW